MRHAVVVAALTCLPACAQDTFDFYQVTRTRTEECTIRANGEFCEEPDSFEPPVVEVWALQTRPEVAVLTLQGTTWVLDAFPEGVDPTRTERTGHRRSVVTSEGPCTTTTEQDVRFFATVDSFAGELRTRTVLEGAEVCGATPVGTRTVEQIDGIPGVP